MDKQTTISEPDSPLTELSLQSKIAGHSVLLFDGVCNFCNHTVQFIHKRDKKDRFRFAALQSDIGQQLLRQHNLPTSSEELDSVVMIEDGKAYIKSSAGLRIALRLGKAWPLLYGFVIVPKFIRNPVYDWVARNRYRWFGEKNTCAIPSPELRRQFL